ncbi:hypothetical protein KC19_12G106500, partial [Ceratodon purpureus]
MTVRQERFPAPRECHFLQPKSVRGYADLAPGSTQFRVISQCSIYSRVPQSRMLSDTVRPAMNRSSKAVKIWLEMQVLNVVHFVVRLIPLIATLNGNVISAGIDSVALLSWTHFIS